MAAEILSVIASTKVSELSSLSFEFWSVAGTGPEKILSAGAETGPEILLGTKTGTENLTGPEAGPEMSTVMFFTRSVVSSAGKVLTVTNLYLRRGKF